MAGKCAPVVLSTQPHRRCASAWASSLVMVRHFRKASSNSARCSAGNGDLLGPGSGSGT